DLIVTPNHNLYLKRCTIRFPGADRTWELKQARNIASRFRRQEFRMMSCPRHAWGNNVDRVGIPQFGKRYSRSRTLSPIPIESFMRLAGWYLSEGHARPVPGDHAGQFVISQTEKNPAYREEIISLLASLGLPVHSKTKDIRISNVDLAKFMLDHFGSGSNFKFI